MQQTIFWYDLETFGSNPETARIAQVAAQRTTMELEPLGDPINILVRLSDDWLADPVSCVIHGISPQQAQAEGVSELEALQRLHSEWLKPGTIVAGYNSSHFDDIVVRFSNYRNLMPPYTIGAHCNNMRLDLLKVVRLVYGTRPQGIEWPASQDENQGYVSLKLEELSRNNGIEHSHAHDALSDVTASIGLARLIQEKHPKLWDYCMENTAEPVMRNRIGIEYNAIRNAQPLLVSSGNAKAHWRRCFLVLPLALHSQRNKEVIGWHLRQDPFILDNLSLEDIHERLFSKQSGLEKKGLQRIEAPTIKLNQSPMFMPAWSTIEHPGMADWLSVDLEAVYAYMEAWEEHGHKWLPKLLSAFEIGGDFPEPEDVDEQLYQGFIPNIDRQLADREVQQGFSESMPAFQDKRMQRIWARCRARNAFEVLSEKEQAQWSVFVRKQLQSRTDKRLHWDDFELHCEQALERNASAAAMIAQLRNYKEQLSQRYDIRT